uniref:Ninjurin 1 n=1 Tax=Oreochromis niloticus TaxID=8128 RepID=A0A669BFF7_ORENI
MASENFELTGDADKNGEAEVPRRGHERRLHRSLNMNHYANKKSAAESMLDVALLMANASQLKAVMQQGPSFTFYVPLIILISISLTLQILVGVLLIFIGKSGGCCQISIWLTLFVFLQFCFYSFLGVFGFKPFSKSKYEPIEFFNSV